MNNTKSIENENQLEFITRNIYEPNALVISAIDQESQNAKYNGYTFKLTNSTTTKSIRFRIAKSTPKKVGQFVAFWEKGTKGSNQPFHIDTAPDLLVITVFGEYNKESKGLMGQFVFPKGILIKHNILRSQSTKGKMGMRVYPSWDKPIGKSALQSQQWQLNYFFKIDDTKAFSQDKILELYAQ